MTVFRSETIDKIRKFRLKEELEIAKLAFLNIKEKKVP